MLTPEMSAGRTTCTAPAGVMVDDAVIPDGSATLNVVLSATVVPSVTIGTAR
jgi:hypothetical protein